MLGKVLVLLNFEGSSSVWVVYLRGFNVVGMLIEFVYFVLFWECCVWVYGLDG